MTTVQPAALYLTDTPAGMPCEVKAGDVVLHLRLDAREIDDLNDARGYRQCVVIHAADRYGGPLADHPLNAGLITNVVVTP